MGTWLSSTFQYLRRQCKKILKIASDGYKRDEILDFKKEIEGMLLNYDKVIISSEAMSVFFNNPIDLFNLFPMGSKFKVIIYFRNQVDKFVSDVNQTIKNSKRVTYELDEPWFSFNNYYNQVVKWGEIFGFDNLLLRGYNKNEFYLGDVVSDFCNVVGLPLLDLGNDNVVNPSLKMPYLELMRQVNIRASCLGDDGWKVKNRLKDFVWTQSVESDWVDDKKSTFVKSGDLELIANRLGDSNKALKDEFGVSVSDLYEVAKSYNCIEPFVGNDILLDCIFDSFKS